MSLPSRAFVVASLVLWRRRESFRYGRWRHYVKTKPRGDHLRGKWFKLYVDAQAHRIEREEQLARLPITHVDGAGIDFIKREEGVRDRPYDDSRGFATVGVGHLIKRGPVSSMSATERERWILTDVEVDALLRKDLVRFEGAVAKAFVAKGALAVTQDRFNAATSLALNIGEGGFASSTVADRIAHGQLKAAADAFLRWDRPPELLPRRKRERALFLRAVHRP